MKFGHHQSFYLRVNWLSKAMKMQVIDPGFFHDELGFEKIGLGRNMVRSLRYWVTATEVMEDAKDEQRKAVHRLTEFGEVIGAHDRFIRMPLTAAVLHCRLASNKERATAWYWYFNECPFRSASSEQLLDALDEWVRLRHPRTISRQSMKKDMDCIRLTYTARSKNEDDPEDVVASPLSSLGLLQESKEQLVKRSLEPADVDIDALYYALLLYCERHEVNSVTLEEMQVKPLLWGKLFQLSVSSILEILERLHADPQYPASFARTNQIYNLTIDREDPNAFLREAYERKAGN